jgi:hypothetical protein
MPRGTVSGNGIVTDGLVLSLDASNIKSYVNNGTIWNDLSKNNNVANLVNGTLFTTSSGGSIYMDGGNEYLRIPPSSNLSEYFSTNNFSIETVVKSDNVVYPRSRHPIYVNGTVTTTTPLGWSAGHTSTATYMQIISGDGVNRQVTDISHNVVESTIYHRVFTINRENGVLTKYYVNGNYIGQANHTSVTGSIYDGITTDFQTGFVFGYVWGWRYIGDVYKISVYNKVLSSEEIQNNYNAIKTRFGL